ncbi:terpene synthase 6, chloroplastic-like [Vicia villosa]|uniref:terpene synthase 6, chloroplastic-like n=1 Tax=Vicia villosa TaxID=3911 RepID=UPI00273A9033|nr:terpene synthase 6, chloroplastic-like [Vicia villosa]XP_058751577.1 terpene synthase 6, chloroplastic-like [Vicia villosa]
MSLSRFIAPLSCNSSTSDSSMVASTVKKNMNTTTALCLEDTKERIKNMFNKVELSISSYDTAFVAMIPSSTSPHTPFFPQCLNWLLDNQLVDGSWGLPDRHPLLMNDALLSTLASILALKQWGIGEDKLNKGLHFIESNFTSINDDKQHRPIGFDILFPSLVEYAQTLGINLPIRATSLEAMIQKRDRELQRGSESNSEGWRAYLAYVSEGMLKSPDMNTIMKYQRKNGSLFNSPATTAAAFHHLKNADCLSYLQSVLQKFGNAVPTVYPLDIYARLYMIDSLERLGINHHFKEEIRSVLDETYRFWLQGDETIFLDPTTCAMAFRMLRLNGYEVSSDPFYRYSEEKFPHSLKGYLKDASAVLELYRASQVIIHPEESVLVKQSSWTRNLLKQDSSDYHLYADKLHIYVDNEVNDVLKFPHHANLERVLNRRSVDHYNVDETRILKTSYRSWNLANKEILKLAVEDFNLCQSIHGKELKQLSRWVVENKLDKLEFARQKLAYCYFSSAATSFSPELSDARISWAKNGVLTTVVDDFFDVGSSEEEQLNLIQLVEKWDVDVSTVYCSEAVKIIFSAVRSTICEIGENSVERQGRNVKDNVIKIWLDLMRSMYTEAEWLRTKATPTMDDYMQNAYVSFALGPIVLPALYLVGPKLSDDAAVNQELNHLYKTMSICGRLLNDIQGFKRESEEGKLNAVSLHTIHSNGAVTYEDAVDKMKGVIEDKRRELLRLVLKEKGSLVPRDCKDLFWKMMKVLNLFYIKDDGFTSNEMHSTVNAVLKDPIILDELLVDSKSNTLSQKH